ncbi:hypothetical protein N790_15105 [Arenimonas malthae CC-JY-1]|uniref:Uncharacterized protein n=1 Tax=Arenimonas malthae CC-JY-1 TaxID=1384054 RepID=A0A091BEW6_9GAMM|nr:hypothetical protein N790_15105 [Arenimonas malthae CC-JY-1]
MIEHAPSERWESEVRSDMQIVRRKCGPICIKFA